MAAAPTSKRSNKRTGRRTSKRAGAQTGKPAAHHHRQPAARRRARGGRRWSRAVTERSDALDLEPGVFTGSADEVAQSLKRSALRSRRRKGTPLQSAMSMLNFYINRAGRNLPKSRKAELQRAKGKLREAFGRDSKPR